MFIRLFNDAVSSVKVDCDGGMATATGELRKYDEGRCCGLF